MKKILSLSEHPRFKGGPAIQLIKLVWPQLHETSLWSAGTVSGRQVVAMFVTGCCDKKILICGGLEWHKGSHDKKREVKCLSTNKITII
jgi:hypothetical protein